jgi:predicted type IV restriction endonuclease
MSKEETRQRIEAVWRKLSEKLKQPGVASIKEETTKAFFITPLLEALGWDMNDIELEYVVPKLRDKVDYALKTEGEPVLLLEAKRLGEELDDQKRKQLLEYGSFTNVAFGVLTNGVDLELHDLTYKGPIGGSLLSTMTLFYVAFNMALIHGQFVRLFRAPLLDARLANPCSA